MEGVSIDPTDPAVPLPISGCLSTSPGSSLASGIDSRRHASRSDREQAMTQTTKQHNTTQPGNMERRKWRSQNLNRQEQERRGTSECNIPLKWSGVRLYILNDTYTYTYTHTLSLTLPRVQCTPGLSIGIPRGEVDSEDPPSYRELFVFFFPPICPFDLRDFVWTPALTL